MLNVLLGAALVGVAWLVIGALQALLPRSAGDGLMIAAWLGYVVWFPVGGYIVARVSPRGFLGVSLGVYLGWFLPALFFGGPTAKAIDMMFGLVCWAITFLGESGRQVEAASQRKDAARKRGA